MKWLIIIFFAGIVFAQNGGGPGKFLIISPSIINYSSGQNRFYTDYYRRIYNDSAIVNPNYIMPPPDSGFGNFVFTIPFESYSRFLPDFRNNSWLDFIVIGQDGTVQIEPGIISRIIKRNFSLRY